MPQMHRVGWQHRPGLQSCAGHNVKSHLQTQAIHVFLWSTHVAQVHGQKDWMGTPSFIEQLGELENALVLVHPSAPWV